MSTDVTLRTSSTSSEQTERLAERLGKVLRGGEVIELVGDLGGGKTTFVRGLVRGAGSPDKVSSPTFTISKLYKTGGLEIHHFDFYRLQEPGIIAEELAEVAGSAKTITIIEWADVVQHVLPSDRLTIAIKLQPDGSRVLDFACPESLGYLMEAIK